MAEVKICDEDGDPLPPRAEGTVYFAGGGEFEYHNDPAKDRREPQQARLDDARRRRLAGRGRLSVTSPTARAS